MTRGRTRQPTALELALWHRAVREVVRLAEAPSPQIPSAGSAPAPPAPATQDPTPQTPSPAGPDTPSPPAAPPSPPGVPPLPGSPTGDPSPRAPSPRASPPLAGPLGRSSPSATSTSAAEPRASPARTPSGRSPSAGPPRVPPPAPEPAPPRPAPLDRRTLRRLERGLYPISARLDLHGLDQAAAHRALESFVAQAQARGHRCVLVITGRGERSGGVLRRSVPRWLLEPAQAARVLGWAEAGRAHGGAGALYLLLRRLPAAATRPSEPQGPGRPSGRRPRG